MRVQKGERQKKQLMGIQEIIREMGGGLVSYFSGLIGVIVFGYTFYKVSLQ